jgi:hypothetical protein
MFVCMTTRLHPDKDYQWLEVDDSCGEHTLRFMAAEAKELRPRGEMVITRLADIPGNQAIDRCAGPFCANRDARRAPGQAGGAGSLSSIAPCVRMDRDIARPGGRDVALGVRRSAARGLMMRPAVD